ELEFGRLHHRQVGGLRTFEDFAGIDAHLTKRFREIGSVAHQPADCHIITHRISRWNPAARRQSGKLHGAADEECIAADEEGIWALALKGGEGRIDLADSRGVENLKLQPDGGAASCTIRNWDSVDEALAGLRSTATRTALGTKSCRSRGRFAASPALKKLIPVTLPPGRARLATRPSLTGSSPMPKTIGVVAVAALAA